MTLVFGVQEVSTDRANLILGDCISGVAQHPLVRTHFDLAIADPPYFKVVGEKWDYAWRTLDDYLAWSGKWIAAVANVLRLGGTMYLFGYAHTLAKMLPLCEAAGMKFRQQIVVSKGIKAVAGRATRKYKMFPTCTEHIYMFVKDPIPAIRKILIEAQSKTGLTAKEINESLGVKSNGGGMWSIWTGRNVCEQLPTKEQWKRLSSLLGISIPYNNFAQTFNAQKGQTDVWTDIDFYSEKRIHPTQKPESLIERLVLASSNPGDSVLDPFAGAGTVSVVCHRLGRECAAYEIDEEYYRKAMCRLAVAQEEQPNAEM